MISNIGAEDFLKSDLELHPREFVKVLRGKILFKKSREITQIEKNSHEITQK